jgi:type IV secretory pathway TraG/TraD family ATPase VirD4
VDILAAHGQENLARALAAQHAAAPEERSASWRTAEQSILALYDHKVAAIFGKSARDKENFSITKWLTEGGTVFLIGEEDEGSSLAPILAAFSRAILDTAKVIAARMPNGRLDPPFALLGDELANVAPLPQIPSLMSVSGSQNIFLVAVLQNLAQAHERWGELGVRKMFAAATIKVILGGVSDEQELKTYSQLAGEFEEDTESISDDGDRASISISTRRRAVLEPGDIRQIKEREGLVVHRRTPVTRVKFERIHEGPRAMEISEATKEALQKVNSHAASN